MRYSYCKKYFSKKISKKWFFLSFVFALASADLGFCDNNPSKPLVEAKVGYFFFSDSTMSKIYNSGGLDLQLSGSYPMWEWLHLYGSLEYLEKKGKSLNSYQNTSIWEIPISIGIKPTIAISSHGSYYFSVGPRYFYVHQHNQSSYVQKGYGHNTVGCFVNTGFNCILWNHFLLDLFGEYSYGQVHISSSNQVYGQKVQIGGFSFGGGLGYAF